MLLPRTIVFVLLFFQAGTTCVIAQLNAIAGYDISAPNAGIVSSVLQDFNRKYDPTVAFKDIRILHGFTAGLRYHYELGAFELAYNRRFTRRIGDYFSNVQEMSTFTDANFFYEVRAYMLSTEFGGAVRLGASIDLNTYILDMDYSADSFRDVKVKQRPLGNHLFIGGHLKDRFNLSFSFRLYYQFIWSDLTVASFRNQLALSPCSSCSFRPSTFGFTLILNNGEQ